MADLTRNVPFGAAMKALFAEYQTGETLEARLAHDADQLSLIVELKALQDVGYDGPEAWFPHVVGRLKTQPGRELAAEVLKTDSKAWWFEENGGERS